MGLNVLLPCDWLNESRCQDLIEDDPLHLYRWLQLVSQAKRNGKSAGVILTSEGEAMRARDMRRTFGYGDDAAWQGFLDLCVKLGLLSQAETGAYSIAKWRGVWYVPNSEQPEAVAARKRESRARAAKRDNRDVTDVTDVTTEQNRTEQDRTEQNRGSEDESVVEFNALKRVLAPYQLSWAGETTKRLKAYISRNNKCSAERRRAAIDASIAKLRTGAITNNNYAVWNVLDDANRSLSLAAPGPAPPAPIDRLELANQQRKAAMGR